MNHVTKLTLSTDTNGDVAFSNDRTTIIIRVDGTVVVSTLDPLQLTGATLAKFDDPRIAVSHTLVTELLQKRAP